MNDAFMAGIPDPHDPGGREAEMDLAAERGRYGMPGRGYPGTAKPASRRRRAARPTLARWRARRIPWAASHGWHCPCARCGWLRRCRAVGGHGLPYDWSNVSDLPSFVPADSGVGEPPPNDAGGGWAEPADARAPDGVADGDAIAGPAADAAPETVLDEIVAATMRRSPAGGCRCGGGSHAMAMEAEGPPSIDVAKAVRNNRRLASSLGWAPHFDTIARLLGFTRRSTDEAAFAEAVAAWQAQQGLGVDGIIGPQTWSRIQSAIGTTPSPGAVTWPAAGSSGGLVIISRAQWGAKPPEATTKLKQPVDTVYIHHTAGNSPGPTLASEKEKMRAIQREHQVNRGWSDIGYNFVIMPSGRIGEGRGWQVVGAHTENHNSHSVGISFSGTFETVSPTPEAMAAARGLIAEGLRLGVLRHDFKIRGHRDTKATGCPGQRLYGLMPNLDPRR